MSINSTCHPNEATGNSEPPSRVLLQRLGGAALTGASVLLEAQITKFRTLGEARLSVSNWAFSVREPDPNGGRTRHFLTS